MNQTLSAARVPDASTKVARRRQARGRRGVVPAIFLAALAAATAHAQSGPGALLVAPTRIVFEGRTRTAEVTLVNTGSSTATYRISFVQLRMSEQGGTTEIETGAGAPGALLGERFADSLIRYSPRQVTLEPRVAQTVRMQLRLPADLPPGEYRSHLLFRAVPPAAAAPTVDPGFSVQLTAIYGVSIPVIVRHGETSAATTLSALTLVPPTAAAPTGALSFRIDRTGDRSIYGDLTATFVPAAGKPSVVGLANGVAVYTPNATRTVGLALTPARGVVLRNGRLHLAYTEQSTGNEKIAEADLLVP